MSDPRLALQGWITATLKGDSPPLAVFDKVPASSPFPRVTIGPGQTLPGEDDGQCGATFDVFQQIDVWSRAVGYPECSTIAGRVKDLLHNAVPTLTGFTVVLLEWRSTNEFRDPDGLTTHAVMSFHALIDEAPPASP